MIPYSAAFGLYHTAVYVGMGIAFVGGPLSESIGWRPTVLAYGMAGYVILMILFGMGATRLWAAGTETTTTPTTTATDNDNDNDTERLLDVNYEPRHPRSAHRVRRRDSLVNVTAALFKIPKFRLLCSGASITFCARFALAAYLPVLYEKHFQLASTEYGFAVGLLIIVGGSLSSAMGGRLSDWVSSDKHRAIVCAFSQWLPLPCWLGALLAPDRTMSFVWLFLAMLLGDAYLGVAASMLQLAVPRHLRSRASMYYLGFNTLLGGCGPLLVAVILQFTRLSIQEALVVVTAVCMPISGLLFLMSGLVQPQQEPPLEEDAAASLRLLE